MRALQAGSEEAYAELVARYGERLYAVARRYVDDDEDARDAVQETFLAAYRAIDRFEGASALATWLHRIAVNAALMIRRRRRSKPELALDLPELHALVDAWQLETLAAWEAPADIAVERRELAGVVRAALRKLIPSHRAVLLLRDLGGLDNARVAALLGTTVNAVKIRAYRARLALRDRLQAVDGLPA